MVNDQSAYYAPPTTVREFLLSAFPNWKFRYHRVDFEEDLRTPKLVSTETTNNLPLHPADVFGAMALLLELGGVYSQFDVRAAIDIAGDCYISDSEIAEAVEMGNIWRGERKVGTKSFEVPNLPTKVRDKWNLLAGSGGIAVSGQRLPGDEDVYSRRTLKEGACQSWWSIAHYLLIASDEAGRGIADPADGSAFSYWRMVQSVRQQLHIRSKSSDMGEAEPVDITDGDWQPTSSLAPSLNRELGCVAPKFGTPDVGCNLRTLSHHLSFIPPRGLVRASFHPRPHDKKDISKGADVADRALNILLVPFPYRIRGKWFADAGKAKTSGERDKHRMFRLEQGWLNSGASTLDGSAQPADVLAFVTKLINEAKKDIGEIHGIVFPEYSINWITHKTVAEALEREFPEIEFVISGSSSNCYVEKDGGHRLSKGNFAVASVFHPLKSGRALLHTSRPKHHRWRLESTQLASYELVTELDPGVQWWENINLPERDIFFHQIRRDTVFTAMICEDLARSEPCHDLLRAISPSLIFVLLMDGPQVQARWPCRYSTILAEDPGSSVLTITSRGLVERNNRTRPHDVSWSIGVWKDRLGAARTIPCEPGNHAVVITLSAVEKDDVALDGRRAPNAIWCLHGQRQIRLEGSEDLRKRMGAD